METMKKQWGKALVGVQRFVPQYCQTPCGDGEKYWTGTCDYSGRLYKDKNGNGTFDRSDNWRNDEGNITAYSGTNTSEGHRCTLNSDPSTGDLYFIFDYGDVEYKNWWSGLFEHHEGWVVKQGAQPLAKGYLAHSQEDSDPSTLHFIVFDSIVPHNPS